MVNPMDLGWFFHGSTQREVTIGLRPGSTRRVERGEGLLVLLLGWWKTHGNHGEIMGQCWAINHGFNDGPEGFSDGFFWFCESWWVKFWLTCFFLMGFSGSVNHDGSNFGWSGFFWCVFLVLLIMMGQILVEVVFLMGFSDGFFWFC